MAFSRSFAIGLIARLIALCVAVGLLAGSIVTPGLVVARLIAALLVAATVAALWRYVDRTNREVARFLDALRFRDFSQSFAQASGGGFEQLGRALDDSIRAMREARAEAADEGRLQAALLEEASSALLLVESDGRVALANKAARKLFAKLPGTRLEDFGDYGQDVVCLLRDPEPVERRLVSIATGTSAQRALASRSLVEMPGRRVAAVAIQPIQEELSSVELTAQADLVRVLTHEIMNSITPVVSLAESARSLMAALDRGHDPAIADAHLAVETLARRSEGIVHFVEAYRAFAHVPQIQRQRFEARPWIEEIARLFKASPLGHVATPTIEVASTELRLDGDPDLLAQVMLNLLKNAAEAARDVPTPAITIGAAALAGGAACITVRDNGPGIDPARREEIFLPFFTTKPTGTGVGLSLARRIMAAHGGSIAVSREDQGARFDLIL